MYIITGGSGFIGTNLAIRLLNQGQKVKIIDLKEPKKEVLENPNCEFVKEDIRYYEFKAEKEDVVVHLAAQVGVYSSLLDPKYDAEDNILGTINVIKNSEQAKLIYASSAAIYGNPKYTPIDEEHPKNPISPYGLSKHTAEQYVHMLHKNSVALRFFNVYGPWQDAKNPYSGVISIFIKNALEGKPLTVYGGKQKRDFIFVQDIVDGILLAKNLNGYYNLGTGTSISIDDLAKTITNIIPTEIKHEPLRQGDVMETLANIEKIKAYGFVPKTSLNEGIEKTIEWIKGYL